jgi:hypothetical protein
MDYFVTSDDLNRLNIPYLKYGSENFIENLFKYLNERCYCMILYEITPHNGHWVVILKGKNLEFFDSYGLKVDNELKYAYYANKLVNGKKILHDLFENTNEIIEYNGKRLQKMVAGTAAGTAINTCGKWCLLRIYAMCHFPKEAGTLRQFLNYVKKNKISDSVLGNMNIDSFIY